MVHLLLAAMVAVPAFALFFDSSGSMIQDLGRNPTLTGRTAIWETVLPLAGNSLIGTGYESFWIGERREKFWSANNGAFYGINEAHNGYIELYLNLGWIGVALLAVLIVMGYPKVMATFRGNPAAGSLGLAFFASELIFNFTEAGFRMMNPLWIFFLLALVGIPAAPVPQSPSGIDADLAEDVVAGEPDFDHVLGATFRKDLI
jgi:O-antigen ligase